ncbi:MAG TPA: glycosyltransferase family 2 protein [Thermoanaerobaculia bacterium]|nr:glycosyltransferase family 2 protein [Thermoanaerobaculia bacterium]
MPAAPEISGVVVHWSNEAELGRLVAAWPEDSRFELIVVDNGSTSPLPPGPYQLLSPGRNLGFAGGVNRGVAAAAAPVVLLLNPDARPEPGALERLLEGLVRHPEAAGLAPRLVGEGGQPQFRWQLRRLPMAAELCREALFGEVVRGPRDEPPAGTPVEQPAAAALALRKEALATLGGLDEGYFPAWFEDVDLGRRLRSSGRPLLYWPDAVFRHGQGASVPRLGYGLFLWIYDRNARRYLRRHHGRVWAGVFRAARSLGLILRLLLSPVLRPRRAGSRQEALLGQAAALAGVLSGWRWPRSWARRHTPPRPDHG